MGTLYIHIGTHKTGSSAIQVFCASNAANLKKQGVCYPVTGRGDDVAHHYFSNTIRTPINPDYPPEKEFQEYVQNLAEEIDAFPISLISTEIFSASIDFKPLVQVKKTFGDVKIIVYFRRQDHWLESSYNEGVKSTVTISEPLGDIFINNHDIRRRIDYWSFLSPWIDIFGAENIVARPYEKIQFYQGNLFSDFFNIVGIELGSSYVYPDQKVNASLCRDTLEFKRLVNALELPKAQRFHAAFTKGVSDYGVTCQSDSVKTNILSPLERIRLMDKYSEGNSIIARQLLCRNDGQLFNEPLPNANTPWEPYPGLPEDKARTIVTHIAKHDLAIVDILKEAVKQALASPDDRKRSSAEALSWL